MEYIYADNAIEDSILRETFLELFPALKFFRWDFISTKPEGLNLHDNQHVVYETELNIQKIEFKFRILLHRTREEDSQERALHIGRRLSEKLNIRVLTPFRDPQHPEYPYCDIIFKDHRAYLADDFNTNFADGSTGLVEIIGMYELPIYTFDAFGNLIRERHAAF